MGGASFPGSWWGWVCQRGASLRGCTMALPWCQGSALVPCVYPHGAVRAHGNEKFRRIISAMVETGQCPGAMAVPWCLGFASVPWLCLCHGSPLMNKQAETPAGVQPGPDKPGYTPPAHLGVQFSRRAGHISGFGHPSQILAEDTGVLALVWACWPGLFWCSTLHWVRRSVFASTILSGGYHHHLRMG